MKFGITKKEITTDIYNNIINLILILPYYTKMDAAFVNSESSKIFDLHGLVLKNTN